MSYVSTIFRQLCAIVLLVGCARSGGIPEPDEIFASGNKQLVAAGFEHRELWGTFPNYRDPATQIFSTKKYKFTSVEETRVFICTLFQEYVQPIVENTRLRPYLLKPVDSSLLSLVVLFEDENGALLSPPYMAVVQCFDGEIFYSQKPKEASMSDVIYTESFEEAERIVAKSRNRK